MAQQVIFTGTTLNDGTGDSARAWATKSNANFTELYDAVAGKANSSHAHNIGDITGFTEAVQDILNPANGFLVQGNNITLTYDDAANTLTITSSGGGSSLPTAGANGELLTVVNNAWTSAPLSTASLNAISAEFTGGGTQNFFKVDITNTSSAANSMIFAASVGNVNKFMVGIDGSLYMGSGITVGSTGYGIGGHAYMGFYGFKMRSDQLIGIASSTSVGSSSAAPDAAIGRAAAGVLGIRNGSTSNGASLNFIRLSTIPTPGSANQCNIGLRDNAGVDELVVVFSNGTTKALANNA